MRVVTGVGGAVALLLGVILLVWPEKSLGVIAVVFGINFVLLGMLRLGLSIFTRGVSTDMRVLHCIFGVLLVVVGVVVLRNSAVAGGVLALLLVVAIGIGWIVEGVQALAESRSAQPRALAVLSAVVSIAGGVTLLVLPVVSPAVLAIVGGVGLVVIGGVGVVRAVTGRAEASG